MRKITDEALKRQLAEARDSIVESPWFFSDDWIARSGRKVIAAVNLSHFYDDEIVRLVEAYAKNGDTKLFAISNENYSFSDDHAYELASTFAEFEQLELAYFGEFFILLNHNHSVIILFTAAGDFKLIAAPTTFLLDYGERLPDQKRDFADFAKSQLSYPNVHAGYRENMLRALNVMDWIE